MPSAEWTAASTTGPSGILSRPRTRVRNHHRAHGATQRANHGAGPGSLTAPQSPEHPQRVGWLDPQGEDEGGARTQHRREQAQTHHLKVET